MFLQHKRSFQIALGGIVCALGLVSLMLTGFIPFATYSLPCIAGFLLVVVVVECGAKWAWVCYTATALLSLMITPDREAAIMYVAFFGSYTMIKQQLERRLKLVTVWVCKLAIFNVAVVAAYGITIYLLGMKELLQDMEGFGTFSLLFTLGLGNVVFILYDIAMTRILSLYLLVLRKKIFKRF